MKMSSFSGSQKKNDKLKAAANIHVKIGHMQRYCELMVEIGEVRLYCTEKHVFTCRFNNLACDRQAEGLQVS